jgi:hypothetical protein
VLLRLVIAVIDGAEQLRIQSSEPRQIFGVHFVVLTPIFVNESQLARICDDHLVTQFAQKT